MNTQFNNHEIIFVANNNNEWMQNYCAAPAPSFLVESNSIKIYFGARDKHNSVRIGYCIYDLKDENIIEISKDPILALGKSGCFDDNAQYPCCVVEVDDVLYLYYAGRSQGVDSLYYVSLGLCKSIDRGVSFIKHSSAPIMERSTYDPWMVGLCHVIKNNSLWEMLYTSGTEFDSAGKQSKYDIKYAYSQDGINWVRNGTVCIPSNEVFKNVAAPTVVKVENLYHMWFCYHDGIIYRIGYAFSYDCQNWEINFFPKNFQNMEASYPKSILINDKVFIFYSAGRYGLNGIGLTKIPVKELR